MTGPLAILMLIAALAPAQMPPKHESAPKPRDRRSAPQPEAPPNDHPTAEDLLRALQRERPANEVIPPSSAKGGEWPRTKRKLLPEGSTVIDRTGSVLSDGDGWRFRFDDAQPQTSYRLLPNALLDVLVHVAESADGAVSFVISGELTTFADENFVLLRSVSRASQPAGGVSAIAAAAPGSPTDADPVDVLKVLTAKEPKRPVLSTPSTSEGDARSRRGQRRATLIPDGTPLVDRPGRILRDGPWWTFVPESDRPDRIEPSLRLLPNQRTEFIAKSPNAETGDLVFVLSGEITQFQGENYLLPRATIRPMASDNLRK